MELGFFLSYYRNFAIPGIASTLHKNAEIQQRPMKRSYDTGIVIYELIANGLDSSRGQEMVALLNRVHRNVPGSKEDFLYVLLTLLVVPIRWTQKHAWRQPTASELAAASRFFTELGLRMNITGMPVTYQEAEEFFASYEAKHVAPSAAGQHLMDVTVHVFQSRLPSPLRPLARQLISNMLDDDRLNNALGLPRTSKFSRAALQTGLAVRNAVTRRRPLKLQPHFTPGAAGSTMYPDGYSLDQIGPVNVPRPPLPQALADLRGPGLRYPRTCQINVASPKIILHEFSHMIPRHDLENRGGVRFSSLAGHFQVQTPESLPTRDSGSSSCRTSTRRWC